MNGVTAVEAKILHAHKMNYSPLPQLMYIPQGLPVPGVIILWDLHDRFQLRDAMDHPRLWTLHERIGMNFSENSVRCPVETERNGDISSRAESTAYRECYGRTDAVEVSVARHPAVTHSTRSDEERLAASYSEGLWTISTLYWPWMFELSLKSKSDLSKLR